MANGNLEAFNLTDTYIHLSDGPVVTAVEVDEDFWENIHYRTELHEGRLVTVIDNRDDWSHWEMHPAGEEVVILLSGEINLVLEEAGEEAEVELKAGQAFIVPRGVWHRAVVFKRGQILTISRGIGTQHRPV